MAGKKIQAQLTPEEKLQQALVPEAEQPYKVPANWCWTRLGNVTKIIGGGTPSTKIKEYYENGNIPWLSPIDLSNYSGIYIKSGAKNITELGLQKSSAKLLPPETVCLSSRAPIGYVVIAANWLCTNQGFKSFLPSMAFISKYLYWFLKNNNEILKRYASGTTFLELSASKAALIEFPLPPLAEQQRIVERIESLFAKLDEAKENLQNVLYGFETRKAAILHKAFAGELTANWRKQHGVSMDSWETKSLKDCSILITKGSSPRWQGFEYINDITQTLFITSENVREGFLDLTKRKYLDNKINEIQKRSILKKGDVLVNIVGASIGRSAIFEFDCLANTNQAVCIVRTNKLLYNRFLCFFLNSPRALVYYDSNKVETARANISLTDIANIQISIPPISEQTEIVRIIDDLLAKEQQAKELAENAITKIDIIKKSILARAFRGELGTNNPADEPAVELLKRVL